MAYAHQAMNNREGMIWDERLVKEARVSNQAWRGAEQWRTSGPPQTARGAPAPRVLVARNARPVSQHRSGAQTARYYRSRPPVTLHSLRSAEPPLVRKRPHRPTYVNDGLPPVDINFHMPLPPRTVTTATYAAGLGSGNDHIFASAGGRTMCGITKWKDDLLRSGTRL